MAIVMKMLKYSVSFMCQGCTLLFFFSFFYSITAIFYMLHKEQGSTKFGEPCTVMQLIIAEHSNDSATKGLLTLLTWIQFC